MNKITFRAWDIKEKAMMPAIGITEDGTPFLLKSVSKKKIGGEMLEQNASCWAFRKDEVIMMQDTLIPDKNGKHIYEGDRVKRRLVDFSNDNGYIDVIYEVQRGKWCYCLYIHDKQMSPLDTIVARDLEVVGNIYERS